MAASYWRLPFVLLLDNDREKEKIMISFIGRQKSAVTLSLAGKFKLIPKCQPEKDSDDKLNAKLNKVAKRLAFNWLNSVQIKVHLHL